MTKRKKLTTADRAKARELRNAGQPLRAIGQVLGASHEAVRAVLAEPAPGPEGAFTSPTSPAAVVDDGERTIDDDEALLTRLMVDTDRIRRDEETAGRTGAAQAATRLIAKLVELRRAVRPPEPSTPPEQWPDMIQAADRGRAKMHDLLERMIKQRAAEELAAGVCDHCGQTLSSAARSRIETDTKGNVNGSL